MAATPCLQKEKNRSRSGCGLLRDIWTPRKRRRRESDADASTASYSCSVESSQILLISSATCPLGPGWETLNREEQARHTKRRVPSVSSKKDVCGTISCSADGRLATAHAVCHVDPQLHCRPTPTGPVHPSHACDPRNVISLCAAEKARMRCSNGEPFRWT